jgi:predicted TIM-barrel fold metal-dependent hydrolase
MHDAAHYAHMTTPLCSIDVHAHAYSASYVQLLGQLGASADAMHSTRGVNDDVNARLEAMDAGRVQRQVLSMSAATPYFDDVAAAQRAARFINDEHAELCRRYPERFSFFAVLPMPNVDAALAELERAVTDLGAVGVTFTTQILGRALSDPAFADVFAELDRRAMVVFLHPPGNTCESPIIRESGLGWSLGAPIEDAVCAMQLMRAGFPRRYPHMKVILPHLGGFLAFVRYRVSRNPADAFPGEDAPSVQMRKFWYDTANGEPAALRASMECYGVDKLLFGTDYPYWLPGTGYEQAVSYVETSGLNEADVAAIRYENARKLFGNALFG